MKISRKVKKKASIYLTLLCCSTFNLEDLPVGDRRRWEKLVATPDSIFTSKCHQSLWHQGMTFFFILTFSSFLHHFFLLPLKISVNHPHPPPHTHTEKISRLAFNLKESYASVALQPCMDFIQYIHACVHFSWPDTCIVPGITFSPPGASLPLESCQCNSNRHKQLWGGGVRLINCVKMNVSLALSSTAHFIKRTPVRSSCIHLLFWSPLPPSKKLSVPHSLHSLSLHVALSSCKTSLIPLCHQDKTGKE